MTGGLMRAPDQFRPSRDMPMAATPTCCCCCCCCIGTLITSTVVLPMTVELARREPGAGPAVDDGRVRASKSVVALSPFLAFGVSTVVGGRSESLWMGLVAAVAVLLSAALYAFSPFGRPQLAIVTTVVVVASFGVEFVIGFFGILGTAGIGYLIYVVLLITLVVRAFQGRLRRGGGPPGPAGAGVPTQPYRPPPPPVPRPPSSDS